MADVDEFYLEDLVHEGTLLESSSGDLDTVRGLSNLKQALYHRLITRKGSLIHRPDYGVGIKDYQNAVGSLSTYRKLAQAIDEQFRQDFRVLNVTNVAINQDISNPGLFKIVVTIQTAGYAELPLTFVPFGEE
jgi:phage baseplate assembly protein W